MNPDPEADVLWIKRGGLPLRPKAAERIQGTCVVRSYLSLACCHDKVWHFGPGCTECLDGECDGEKL